MRDRPKDLRVKPCVPRQLLGTGHFESNSGIHNELQCGSYAFMDADYGRIRDSGLPVAYSREDVQHIDCSDEHGVIDDKNGVLLVVASSFLGDDVILTQISQKSFKL